MANRIAYPSSYGKWEVTTEGDVEGRSTRHLGTFEGHLDDIAFKLANQCYYSLQFKLIPSENHISNMRKVRASVSVSLDIDSGTWDLSKEQRIYFFRNLLKGRDVIVKEGQYFASVILWDGDSPEAVAARELELKKQAALSKLSAEELQILGLDKEGVSE